MCIINTLFSNNNSTAEIAVLTTRNSGLVWTSMLDLDIVAALQLLCAL